MRYLGLALYAEGPTDYRFLSPILRRVADDLCLRGASDPVLIGEVAALDAPRDDRQAERAARIMAAAKSAEGTFNVLFVHTDGAGDPDRARAERVNPAIQLMAVEQPRWSEAVVAVVPVRETEAWALVDGDALRAAFGTTLNDDQLGLPARSHGVESLLDPKQSLDQVYEKVVGRRRPGRRSEAALEVLGERIRLESSRGLPSFKAFEDDFRQVLRKSRYLHVQ